MQLLSQRNPVWANHKLGNAPSIGLYGCFLTDFTMILKDTGKPYTPATLDDYLNAKKLFINGDLLSDNTLDRAFPGQYKTTVYSGFNAAVIAATVKSKDSYAILHISTASVPSHFVIAWNAAGTLIADPWTGAIGSLAGYGGPKAVTKIVAVKHLAPTPAPAPVPAPTPPAPKPVPPPAPATDYSLQGLLVYLINLLMRMQGKSG